MEAIAPSKPTIYFFSFFHVSVFLMQNLSSNSFCRNSNGLDLQLYTKEEHLMTE